MKPCLQLCTLLGFVALTPGVASAQASTTLVPYEGHLEHDGEAINGQRAFRFEVTAEGAPDQAPWVEEHIGVQVSNGEFRVALGLHNSVPLDAVLRRPGPHRLRVSVLSEGGEFVALDESQRLLAVPFAVSSGDGVPVGSIMPYLGTVPPRGWLVADGRVIGSDEGDCGDAAACSAGYSALVAHLRETLGEEGLMARQARLPDLRGVFLRGANLGRSSDSGNPAGDLGVGDYQDDIPGAHNHGGATEPAGSHSHDLRHYIGGVDGGTVGGFAYQAGYSNPDAVLQAAGEHTHSIPSSTGAETRPRNITVLHIIKY